jgi:hypothetical protein
VERVDVMALRRERVGARGRDFNRDCARGADATRGVGSAAFAAGFNRSSAMRGDRTQFPFADVEMYR